MHKEPLLLIILFSILFSSCSLKESNVNTEGNVTGDTYKSDLIGWKIQIPQGWKVLSKKELYQRDHKGMSYIDENHEGDINSTGKHLIVFQKDIYNNLDATAEPIMFNQKKEWIKFNIRSKKLVLETMNKLGANFDTTSYRLNIANYDFEVFQVNLIGSSGGIVLKQEYYSCYINAHDFSVVISYNNENDRNIMFEAFKKSIITK